MSRRASSCPACGVRIGGITCGECSYSGSSGDFLHNRCPDCGAGSFADIPQRQTHDELEFDPISMAAEGIINLVAPWVNFSSIIGTIAIVVGVPLLMFGTNRIAEIQEDLDNRNSWDRTPVERYHERISESRPHQAIGGGLVFIGFGIIVFDIVRRRRTQKALAALDAEIAADEAERAALVVKSDSSASPAPTKKERSGEEQPEQPPPSSRPRKKKKNRQPRSPEVPLRAVEFVKSLQVLAKEDPDKAETRLGEVISGDERWLARDGAVRVLGRLQRETSVTILEKALDDENGRVRKSAARALETVAEKHDLPSRTQEMVEAVASEAPVKSEPYKRGNSGQTSRQTSGNVGGESDLVAGAEGTIHVFRSNDPSNFYRLVSKIVDSRMNAAGLRVGMLKGDAKLVTVFGPRGSMRKYQTALRTQMPQLADAEGLSPERIRPDETLTNVADVGNYIADHGPYDRMLARIRRGEYRVVGSSVS